MERRLRGGAAVGNCEHEKGSWRRHGGKKMTPEARDVVVRAWTTGDPEIEERTEGRPRASLDWMRPVSYFRRHQCLSPSSGHHLPKHLRKHHLHSVRHVPQTTGSVNKQTDVSPMPGASSLLSLHFRTMCLSLLPHVNQPTDL